MFVFHAVLLIWLAMVHTSIVYTMYKIARMYKYTFERKEKKKPQSEKFEYIFHALR